MEALSPAGHALFLWAKALKEYGMYATSVKPRRVKIEALLKSASKLQATAESRLLELQGLREGLENSKVRHAHVDIQKLQKHREAARAVHCTGRRLSMMIQIMRW